MLNRKYSASDAFERLVRSVSIKDGKKQTLNRYELQKAFVNENIGFMQAPEVDFLFTYLTGGKGEYVNQ